MQNELQCFKLQAWGFHIRKFSIAIMQNGISNFNKQRLGEQTDVLVVITVPKVTMAMDVIQRQHDTT